MAEYKKRRRKSEFSAREEDTEEGIIWGRNPVLQALEGERDVDKIFFAAGSAAGVGKILASARDKGVITVECDRRKLDLMASGAQHQGVVAMCSQIRYREIDEILDIAYQRGQAPLIVLCDGITDSHNLGAIIRSAEVAGAHGVVIQKRRSAGVNAACAKSAAGALEHIAIAKVSNINNAIDTLHEKGVYIFSGDMDGSIMYQMDFKMPCAIVIGDEGKGVSRLTKEKSDFIVGIPQAGRIPSLNASNAAAVLLYEVYRQRLSV